MMPRNSEEESVPGATLKTSRVTVAPPGAVPASMRTSTTTAITTMSTTVMPSTLSRMDAARFAGTIVSSSAMASAIPPMRKPDQAGGLFHTPMASRKAAPKMPEAEAVTRP